MTRTSRGAEGPLIASASARAPDGVASRAVVSPHNSYWLWGPGPLREASRIVLVGFDRRDARRSFVGCTTAGRLEPRAILTVFCLRGRFFGGIPTS